MKLLKDILYKAGLKDVVGSTNQAVDRISFDSREVDKMTAFVAVRGSRVDGHDFIDQAIENGCKIVVCERFPDQLQSGVTYVRVESSREALGIMASNFYDNPSSDIKLVGVTGTNGKTTTVTLLYQLFKALGYKCGLISTVVNRIASREVGATHTTPDPVVLNRLLAEMVVEGCQYCFMEVSSHAIDQRRIAGLDFAGGVFTNITHDHLDYHKTFDNYIAAKKQFFDGLSKDAFALVNLDDPHAEIMVQNTMARVLTYAIKRNADFKAKVMESDFQGLKLIIGDREVWTHLIGSFNAYNILAAYSVAVALGQEPLEVLTMISNLKPPAGRFQYMRTPEGVIGIVDYAHTPDALKNVLQTINDIRTGNDKIITVVGCGGDRDKEKRPLMAEIACRLSDKVILTSDNPRSEDPESILNDMEAGLDAVLRRKALKIPDRKEAIRTAASIAGAGDIILVAGKGHETYQEVAGVRHEFDDFKVLNQILNQVS
ncbi:MAG: UDP-N-acetylmuramoyl-L-alanyl-D-glutamate--2,6-diaminopimelate ligase [Salibacteraceae bacterium]